MDYRQTMLLTNNIASLMSNDVKPISFDDMYGDLFDKKELNKSNEQSELTDEMKLKVLEAQFRELANMQKRHK